MRAVVKVVGIVVVGLLVVGGIVILGARWFFGPLGPIPGPGLPGSVIHEPVGDWSFVDAIKVVQLEACGQDPYSVHTWLTRMDDRVYVFAGSEESSWVQCIGRDPRVRVGIDGRIYERRAVRVEDLGTKHAFLTAMRSKYEGDMGFDLEFWQRAWDTGELVLFRMEPR